VNDRCDEISQCSNNSVDQLDKRPMYVGKDDSTQGYRVGEDEKKRDGEGLCDDKCEETSKPGDWRGNAGHADNGNDHLDNFDDTREGDKVPAIELQSFSYSRVNCSRSDGKGS